MRSGNPHPLVRKSKGDAGRHDCNLCPESTRGQDVALFYRLDVRTGQNHVVMRAHASHFDPARTDAGEIIRNLAAINLRMKAAA